MLHKLYNLCKLRKYIDQKVAIAIYKQVILPILDFGDFVLESAPEGAVNFLQTIQNHFLRCCLLVKHPLDMIRIDLHKNSDCNWLIDRRKRGLLSLMYTQSKDQNNVMEPVRVLRGNNKVQLKVRHPKGALYRKSPLYRGRALWSELDEHVQKSLTKKIFLSRLLTPVVIV